MTSRAVRELSCSSIVQNSSSLCDSALPGRGAPHAPKVSQRTCRVAEPKEGTLLAFGEPAGNRIHLAALHTRRKTLAFAPAPFPNIAGAVIGPFFKTVLVENEGHGLTLRVGSTDRHPSQPHRAHVCTRLGQLQGSWHAQANPPCFDCFEDPRTSLLPDRRCPLETPWQCPETGAGPLIRKSA